MQQYETLEFNGSEGRKCVICKKVFGNGEVGIKLTLPSKDIGFAHASHHGVIDTALEQNG